MWCVLEISGNIKPHFVKIMETYACSSFSYFLNELTCIIFKILKIKSHSYVKVTLEMKIDNLKC